MIPLKVRPTVELTWYEVLETANCGAARYLLAARADRDQRYGQVATNRWATDIEGALGERVLAKFMGWYWDGALRREARPGDVRDLEARHSVYPRAKLCIHPGDADDTIFVLVTGEIDGPAPHAFQVVGWILGAHAKREEWWGDVKPGLGRPAFWVPQAMLHDPQTLKEHTPKELRMWPAPAVTTTNGQTDRAAVPADSASCLGSFGTEQTRSRLMMRP